MESLKKVQLVVFQRMIEFQRGTMQSETAFITSQISKFAFKDAFIILVFIPPFPAFKDFVKGLFSELQGMNSATSLFLGILLSCFLFMAGSKLAILHERFKSLIRLLIPWLDILSLPIIVISIHLLLLNLPDNPLLAIFNALSVVSVSIIHVFYNLFHFTKEPRSNNLFKKRQASVVCFTDICTLITTYYLAAVYSSSGSFPPWQEISFGFVQLLTSLLTMKNRIFLQYYLSPFSQSVSSLFYFLQLYLSLLVVLIHITQMGMLAENLLILLGSTTMLSYTALQAYLLRRNSAMYLSSASDLKDEHQALLYLDRLCGLISKVENEEEDVILVSLKKKHSLTCKTVLCYCHKQNGTLSSFLKEYVKHELLSMAELFHSSPSILISILYFRMVIFKYYPEVLAKLKAYSSHFQLSLTQRYYRYCLTQYVARFIRKKNYEIDAVDSEHMFKLEQLRAEMEGLIRGEIEVRSKKWKYLSRGLCRVSELQVSCNSVLASIARLTAIFQQSKSYFKKSKKFNLLFLFYFTKVCFLSNGKEIRQNLKELYFGYKEDDLYSLKEFRKFIYHKRSCVIETVVDTKTMGIVSAASRNVQEMFGMPPSKVIGISINNLMPQFMADQHELILNDWARSGTWRTIGKLKQIYCIHKEKYCFSALLYLKLYVKENSLHFITNIFKLNENDYLVANPNFKIEGLGRKFLRLLGEPAKKMPLDLLIQHDNTLLQQENYAQGRVYHKIMLGLRGMEDSVQDYLQSINMKFDPVERQKISLAFHQKLRSNCHDKYFVEFSIQKYTMRTVRFIVLGLKQAKKIDRQQSIQFLERHPTLLHNAKAAADLTEFEEEDSRHSMMERDGQEELLMEHNANSSLTSMTEKENYPLSKTIEKFIGLVSNPHSIQDARLSNFNLIIVLLLILLTVLGFFSFYTYKQVLLEIQGVFFADGAQSDIMQTTQIAYAYTYILRSQLTTANSTEFASTLQSARLVNSYVYSLRESDLASLISNVTVLTKERLYAYIQKPTTWLINGQQQPVLTHQFLQNMYYLTGRIVNQLEALRRSNSTIVNETFYRELFNNFPQMKHLNEFFLADYERTSQQQHSLLTCLTLSSMWLFFLLTLVLAFALNRYFRFRFDQLTHSFTFFTFVPSHYYDKMRDYYSLLIETIVDREKLKTIDADEEEVFSIDTYDLFHKAETGRGGLSVKIRLMNYESYYKWLFILLAFVLANSINYMATKHIRDFFPVSQAVIKQVNNLMRSENKMLEGYFDLRAAYSLDPTHAINQSLVDRLMATFSQGEERFSDYANQLTTIFKKYNTDYEQVFTNTLVTNVCALGAPMLTPFENQKCINQLKLNILDGGILIAMNYFQKSALQALQDLKKKYIIRNDSSSFPQGDYFRQLAFVQLDKMLIYMFKVYQQTQAVTYGAYMVTIEAISLSYLKLIIGMTVFLGVGLLLWLRSIPGQKKALSRLYGHLLQVPFMILKANTRITSSLKEAIEYSD